MIANVPSSPIAYSDSSSESSSSSSASDAPVLNKRKASETAEEAPVKRGRVDAEMTPRPDGCDTVFIGNLSWSIDEQTVRDFFADCGEIDQVRFAEDRQVDPPRFKGFGYVQFAAHCAGEAVDKAVKKNGEYLMDRDLRCDYSAPRTGFSGGGRGGGRGGGFGGGRGGGRGGGFGGGRGGGFGGGRGGGRGGGFGGGRGGGRGGGFGGGRGGGRGDFQGKRHTFD